MKYYLLQLYTKLINKVKLIDPRPYFPFSTDKERNVCLGILRNTMKLDRAIWMYYKSCYKLPQI